MLNRKKMLLKGSAALDKMRSLGERSRQLVVGTDEDYLPGDRISEFQLEAEVTPGQMVSVLVETASDKNDAKIALIAFKFLDSAGEEVPPIEWGAISRTVGPYKYIEPCLKEGRAITQLDIQAPDRATQVAIRGHKWKPTAETWVLRHELVVGEESSSAIAVVGQFRDALTSANLNQVISLGANADMIELQVQYIPNSETSEAPIRCSFRGHDGQSLLPMGDLPIHPVHGSILTLPGGSKKPTDRKWRISVPDGAVSLHLEGIDWGVKTANLCGEVQNVGATISVDAVADFLAQARVSNAPVILIDTTAPPIGHETLALRPNNLSLAYARLGYFVIFVPFSTLQEFSAQPYDRIFQINRKDFGKLVQLIQDFREGQGCHYICSSFPGIHAVTGCEILREKGWTVTYEARDDMEEFNRVGYSKWYKPSLERLMIKQSDVVVSVSIGLDEKLRTLVPSIKNNYIVPNGVNPRVIEDGRALRRPNILDIRKASTVVGYVGHLTPSWFDWELLVEAAKRTPELQYEIVGHGEPDGLALPANVRLLGPKTHEELVPIVREWKVGIIPFKNLPLTRSVDPNKIYEYFAWGLRCVSAPMGIVHEYPSTWVYRELNGFVESVRDAVSTPFTEAELQGLEKFLHTASWDDRAREMADIIGLNEKREMD
ncbi:hypothetical protein [Corynebacterium sp. ED61]|uniref:hypothetical protein n=1 Tax=Corynebacterium sp. ED61 TaxID=2211360 RepID=UPI0018836A82|nr:hypothetical protein [Corynebacterium sp. ED61]MBF0580789.1 hypothetical protein [Corynebacterium sp. ED61]